MSDANEPTGDLQEGQRWEEVPAPDGSRVLCWEPTSDGWRLGCEPVSSSASDRACALCPHALSLHTGLGVRCAVCADSHQYVSVLPPPQPVVFMSEAEARAAIASWDAQEAPQPPPGSTQTPVLVSQTAQTPQPILEALNGLPHGVGQSAPLRQLVTLDLDPEVVAAARAQVAAHTAAPCRGASCPYCQAPCVRLAQGVLQALDAQKPKEV